ncbi:hypothetical protein MNV49_000410 [Pseudohyphozyma bogoriensis]|nr:hypothetical protein MNV49_000410 [Pseudohyphozyma bogoriensis]
MSTQSGVHLFSPALRVYYGEGSVQAHLLEALEQAAGPNVKKPRAFIVTGNSLYSKTPVIKDVEGLLEKSNQLAGIYHEIGQHAPKGGIERAMEEVRKCGADVLVISYKLQEQDGGGFLPQVAVPTTLSAAEFSMVGGHTTGKEGKISVASADIVPKVVIMDAKLSLHTPIDLWLSTGIRALDHAIEALAPIVLGVSHAIGHGLGATYSIPHGTCYNAVPAEFWSGGKGDVNGKEAVHALAEAVDQLGDRLGLKVKLSQFDVGSGDFGKLAMDVAEKLKACGFALNASELKIHNLVYRLQLFLLATMSPPPAPLVTLPSTAPLEDIFEVIKRDGGIIISDFLSPEEVADFNAASEPIFATLKSTDEKAQKLVEMGPDFHASHTTHLRGMLGKLPKQTTTVLQKPLWNAIMHEVLKTTVKAYIGDHLLETNTSHILSLAVGFKVAPGAGNQVLHRDQTIHSVDAKEGSLYTSDLGCLIAGTRSTKANGATRVVPGSHLWAPTRSPKVEEAVHAEMEAGSAMFWFGSAYHGASANTCTPGEPDSVRILYGFFGCQDFLRPEAVKA